MSAREVHVTLTADTGALEAGLARAAHRVSRLLDGYVRALGRRLDHERHQPRPLCIDGHAYRRRRNARRSRR